MLIHVMALVVLAYTLNYFHDAIGGGDYDATSTQGNKELHPQIPPSSPKSSRDSRVSWS